MSRKEKNTRACVACRCEKDKSEFVRISRNFLTGQFELNDDNKIFGRSVYVCKNPSCIKSAVKKGKIAKDTGDFLLEKYS